MQWQADWGLRMRMGGTVVLLVTLYLIFLGVLPLYFQNLLLTVVIIGLVSFGQL